MQINPKIWNNALSLINEHDTILIIGHQRPDPDAIGSMVGLGQGLVALGKTVKLAVDGGTPKRLQFLTMSDTVESEIHNEDEWDLTIFVDSSDEEITGTVGETARAKQNPTLIIDHHVTNTLYGDENIVVEDAVSTTQIITEFLEALNVKITQPIAEALLYGMLGDTRLFQYGPVSGETFATVQKLVDAGASVKDLAYNMRETSPSGVIKLYGIALGRMQVEDSIAWAYLTLSDFEEAGIEPEGVIGAADTMLSAQDVDLVAEFAEIGEGSIRLSLRAEGGYSVAQIAEELGGGGHPKAGGATIRDLTMPQAIEKVVNLLKVEYQNNS